MQCDMLDSSSAIEMQKFLDLRLPFPLFRLDKHEIDLFCLVLKGNRVHSAILCLNVLFMNLLETKTLSIEIPPLLDFPSRQADGEMIHTHRRNCGRLLSNSHRLIPW